jgi:hypothetical protein
MGGLQIRIPLSPGWEKYKWLSTKKKAIRTLHTQTSYHHGVDC